MVAGVRVMNVAFVSSVVPNLLDALEGGRLTLVEAVEEIVVNDPAVSCLSPAVQPNRPANLCFVSRHDVAKVSEALGCVVSKSNVQVDFMDSFP